MQHKEDLFALWLEDRLSPEQQLAFEKLCQQDPVWAARMDSAKAAQADAEQFADFSVPQWDPGKLFQLPQRQPWWQRSWLPVASMAMSAAAIAMVLLNVEVASSDGQLTLRFGDSQQRIMQAVDQKLAAYQSSQQSAMTEFVSNMQLQQKASNAELSNYLLSSSRQERREDFAEFIRFINQQRSDDQIYYARQLNALQDKLYNPSESAPWSADQSQVQE